MANTTSFETSDHVMLKGKVTGVTKISKKVKVLFILGGLAMLGFLIFAIFTIDGGGDAGQKEAVPQEQEQEGQKPKGNDEPATGAAITHGVSNGNAAVGNGSPTIDLGGTQQGAVPGGSASNMVLPAGATASAGAAPAIVLPGAGGATPVANQVGGKPSGQQQPGVTVPAPNGTVAGPAPGPSPAQLAKLRLEDTRAQQREAALKGGTEVTGGGWDGSGAKAQGAAPGSQLFSALPSATGAGGAAANGAAGYGGATRMAEQDDQNKQGRKEAFLREAESKAGQFYLRETRLAPISKYELKMGWKIPAFLIDGMNSDLPGQVCAQVREDVYDSATSKYLLIPQGAKVCGTYDSQIAVGQKRFLTVWSRIIFDDSSSLTLGGMPGADQAGYAGFDADVDNHYFRIYTSALMLSVVSAGVQISQPQQSSTNGPPTAAQTAAGALGQQLGQVSTGLIQRDLKIQPTLTQQPGYRFNIQVTRDIVFPGPYKRTTRN